MSVVISGGIGLLYIIAFLALTWISHWRYKWRWKSGDM